MKRSIQINKVKLLAIVGIMLVKCCTLCPAIIKLQGLNLNMYVVPDIKPIDTDGLIV
jgi:hypothetical protein